MLHNAVVAVRLVFSVHFLAKNSNRYGNLPYFIVISLTNNHGVNKTRPGLPGGRSHGGAIAAVAVARDASTKADTAAAAIAAVAAASEAKAKDIEAAIFDFAASIDMDDEDVAKGVDEAVGNADVVIRAGGEISDGDDRGDGDGGHFLTQQPACVDTAIFDLAESIELDDEDVAKEVDDAGDGNVSVGGDISDDDDRGDGDGDGGGVAMLLKSVIFTHNNQQ
jgi:hypothetical protein